MAGVYNRKLFRQSGARDELRKMGGIMSSSEELMREAMNTAMQAPGPEARGPMGMQQPVIGMPAPPVMQPRQPMMPMQQPMMGQPMQQPMMPMQQPMAQQPMGGMPFMPPQMPQSVQPVGFQEGGPVIVGAGTKFPRMVDAGRTSPAAAEGQAEQPDGRGTISAEEARKRALLAAAGAGGFVPDLSLPGIDIGAEAGSVVEAPRVDVNEDLVATAQDLEPRLEEEPPEAVANELLTKAEEGGATLTGDTQADLAGIYESLTGDPAAYEKNIDQLNRGIIGAAIGAGTSARATENISKGLLVGLEGARETEERRVRDARALQLAELQARTEEAKEANRVSRESRAYRNPVDAYQDAYQAVMNASETDIEIPEGMSREDYADQVATDLIRRSYSADQLVGSPFEGVSAPSGGEGSTQTEEDVLNSARAALTAGADEAAVRERLQALGIDPEKL